MLDIDPQAGSEDAAAAEIGDTSLARLWPQLLRPTEVDAHNTDVLVMALLRIPFLVDCSQGWVQTLDASDTGD